MNFRPQNLQLCGFSPLWIFLCLYRDEGSANTFPHSSQLTQGLPFSSIVVFTLDPLPRPRPLPALLTGPDAPGADGPVMGSTPWEPLGPPFSLAAAAAAAAAAAMAGPEGGNPGGGSMEGPEGLAEPPKAIMLMLAAAASC